MHQGAFREEFFGVLGNTKRWNAFSTISSHLFELQRPVHIAETGCLRIVGNWEGDGQSTAVWGWVAQRTGGSLTSIDISSTSVNAAKAVVPWANIVLSDSICALREIPSPEALDLLYLDSYDVTGWYDSPLHHVGELAAIYERLKSGCLIAVDDCELKNGKDKYIRMIMSDVGAEQICSGYINAWVKP